MIFKVRVANHSDISHTIFISKMMEESTKDRKIGISKRKIPYLKDKILGGNAIFAFLNGSLAGFSYIETLPEEFISNSGMILIVSFRKKGYSRLIKYLILKLSFYKFPINTILGITTNPSVLKINIELGFKLRAFSELTRSYIFWNGCNSCRYYNILKLNNRIMCLCNGYLYKPKHFSGQKIVLAYSGGLDTSYCLRYLTEQGYEVYTAQINTGGFNLVELKNIEDIAYHIGAQYHRNIEATNFYYDNCIKYLIFGNILRNNIYPLSVSSERIFQAIKIAEYANDIFAIAIAHGSTCAGNDQIRFDLAFKILCPQKRILSPIRDSQCSRSEEINYLMEHEIETTWTKVRYSINKGLWGLSIGGEETLTSNKKFPSLAYPSTLQEIVNKKIQLGFYKGEFIELNKEKSSPVNNIIKLEKITSKFAIGRNLHIGDTLIGIKGRIAIQASSALIIIKAHQLLEKHILTKWQIYWKDQLSNWYGILLHESQYLDPVMRNIEAYLRDSQIRIIGNVYIKLSPYRYDLISIKSNFDLMQFQLEKYGEKSDDCTTSDIKGFIKIFGKQMKLYHSND